MVKRITRAADARPGVTMRDVARESGVSQATVSYVLSGKDARISGATRARVLEAAARLRYYPNAIARAMALGRSRTIGVYQPHVSESPLGTAWANQVTRGISEALHERQYHLLLYGYRESDDLAPGAFLDGRVDGLIVLAPHEDDRLAHTLAGLGFPTAVIGGRGPGHGPAIVVDVDNVEGGRMATEHLIRLGHRRIAHLAGPTDVPNAVDRRLGYETALRAHSIPVRDDYIAEASFDQEGGYVAARATLQSYPAPTALFAANDLAAIGAIRACSEFGLHVPRDVAIVGYDDSPVSELASPPLTTMRQPAEEMGRAAAEGLLAFGESVQPHTDCIQHLFTAELIARQSCGTYRAPGKEVQLGFAV